MGRIIKVVIDKIDERSLREIEERRMANISLSGYIPSTTSQTLLHDKTKIYIPRSGSTLYVGTHCNDGRPITESWKYKEAVRLGIPIVIINENETKEENKLKHGSSWVDKYHPTSLQHVIGHKTEIQQLSLWLQQWSNNSSIPEKRGILLTGPPGIGKTTVVHLLAKQFGYAITEYNASDTRSVSALRGMFHLGMRRLRKEVIVMDEVDGLSERGGVAELATIIKKTTIPIFCIANERPPKLKPLSSVCAEMRFSRPLRSTISIALERIVKKEGIQRINQKQIEDICERNGNDIRAILNQLEFYHGEKNDKISCDKDAVHRMEPFSVTQRLFSQKKMTWNEASDQVFVDYHLIPLMVQEAYIYAGRDEMDDIAYAADALSHGEIITKKVYQTQDWGLIPHAISQPIIAVKSVKGGAPSQIFPQLLGKMSKQRKHLRQMEEVGRHMGYQKAVMRLECAEPLRKIMTNRILSDAPPFTRTIKEMDEMGLSRDDLWITLEDTACNVIEIPTKTRSAFTREWNKTHDTGDGIRKVTRSKKITTKKDIDVTEDDFDKEEEEENEDEIWDVDD